MADFRRFASTFGLDSRHEYSKLPLGPLPLFSMQRKGRSKYNMIFEFQYEMNGMQCDMAVTSVTGHLMETDFPPEFKKWNSCDPSALLDLSCPVLKFVRPVRT